MKKIFLALMLSLVTVSVAQAQGTNYVNGYTRDNGTYVQGHQRTNPNSTTLDNYGTRGNYNPNTGTIGTRSPSTGYDSFGGNSLGGNNFNNGYVNPYR